MMMKLLFFLCYITLHVYAFLYIYIYLNRRLLLHIRQDLVYKNEIGPEAGQVAILSIFKVLPKNPKNNNYNNNNNDNNTNSSNGNENDANLPLFAFLNTHLKAKPEFEDLRVKEISVVGNLLVKLRQQYPKISIVIASDMNTEPNGPVYEYLSKVLEEINECFIFEFLLSFLFSYFLFILISF